LKSAQGPAGDPPEDPNIAPAVERGDEPGKADASEGGEDTDGGNADGAGEPKVADGVIGGIDGLEGTA